MRDRNILEPTFEQYKIPRNLNRYPIKVGGVEGIATNDADYVTTIWETLPNGKQKTLWRCPAYAAWLKMIERGHSRNYKEKQPTYQNVAVCEEWCLFSNFRSWWIENNVVGWQLEKDLLVKGNLIYSPHTCAYVPNYLNSLLVDSAAIRGDYPIGVCRVNRPRPYKSMCRVGGKLKYLGLFPTPQEAHRAWQVFKIKVIKDSITRYTEDANNLRVFDSRIVTALEDRIIILQDDINHNQETLALH